MDEVVEAQTALPHTAENATETVAGSEVTFEGMAIAYASLIVMAMLPIFFGSIRSVAKHEEQKSTGQKMETMTSKDAMMFPVVASCSLFGLYIFFKIFSKDYINLLLTGYFFFLGVLALSHLMSPIIGSLMPTAVPKIPFHILLTKGKDAAKQEIINYKFSSHDCVCLFISLIIGVWYLLKKHWIANNLFGLAFAMNGVELLNLNNIITGCILLGGLFFYDILWVFGTNVMVTVARSFDAPIKLVFPQDLIANGLNANKFAMLGLGDIVIPGIFIALLLRFDHSLKRRSKTYFYATFVAYFLGLLATVFVMHKFKHAQPALLYLVPACMGTPLLLALIQGDMKTMFAYVDDPDEQQKSTKKKENTKKAKSSVKKDK